MSRSPSAIIAGSRSHIAYSRTSGNTSRAAQAAAPVPAPTSSRLSGASSIAARVHAIACATAPKVAGMRAAAYASTATSVCTIRAPRPVRVRYASLIASAARCKSPGAADAAACSILVRNSKGNSMPPLLSLLPPSIPHLAAYFSIDA